MYLVNTELTGNSILLESLDKGKLAVGSRWKLLTNFSVAVFSGFFYFCSSCHSSTHPYTLQISKPFPKSTTYESLIVIASDHLPSICTLFAEENGDIDRRGFLSTKVTVPFSSPLGVPVLHFICS